MFKRVTSPATGARARVRAIPGLAYLLAFLPALALFALTLAGAQGQHLLRRDENIMLAILDALARGWRLEDIFLVSISPGVVAVLQALGAAADVVLAGRAAAMLCGAICLLLTAAIARRLYGPGPVPALATALLASSPLFLYEATIIRPNLPALALALAALLALLGAEWRTTARAAGAVAAAGLLFGLAVQVKALALALTPLLLFLLAGLLRRPGRRAALPPAVAALAAAFAGGAAASVVGLAAATGSGATLGQILATHLSAGSAVSPLERLSYGVNTAGQVLLAHTWLVILFGAGLLSALPPGGESRPQAALLAVWCATVAGALVVAFPTWDHHYVLLLPALAIGASALVARAAGGLLKLDPEALGTTLAVLGFALAASGAVGAGALIQAERPGRQERELARLVRERTPADRPIWSDNLYFPLLTGRPIDPVLVDLSIKRIISGQLREEELFALMDARPPAAVLVYDGLFDAFPRLTACLDATTDQTPVSLGGQRAYWLGPGDAERVVACGAGQ
ncbi:MAG TPA: phospholipid carrier-dependent glycosyltransferase [Chloroflexaceae bacterium]|nr:phospholipid carrier-dependent glycosyltransferase [Chloroflexaceae bacterium]